MKSLFEKIRDSEWAYLAAFIDGEGSISVHKRNSKHSSLIKVRIRITNTNKEVIDYICSRFKAYKRKGCKRRLKNAPSYGCSWSGSRCKLILERILPYLIVKKKHAQYAVQFPMSTIGKHINLGGKVKREKLAKKLYELNKKGVDRWGFLSKKN